MKVWRGLALCGLLCMNLARAEIYSWHDAEGKTHFGDHPPAGQAKQVVKPRGINTIEAAKVTPVAAAPAAAGVVMYSAQWCGVCKRAKRYFSEHGVRYDERDIEAREKYRDEFDELGGRGVPLILVGQQRMDGFDPSMFEAMRTAGN